MTEPQLFSSAGQPDNTAGDLPLSAVRMDEWFCDRLDEQAVRRALHDVIDPELGVDIVELGLVYSITVNEANDVAIRMTLTTPGCPLGGYLDDEVHECLRQFAEIGGVSVQLVWSPPWHPSMMSEQARAELGWRV